MGGVLRKLYEKFLIHIREFDKMYVKFLTQSVNHDFLFRVIGVFV